MTEWQEVVFGQKGHLSSDEEKVSGCASRSSGEGLPDGCKARAVVCRACSGRRGRLRNGE